MHFEIENRRTLERLKGDGGQPLRFETKDQARRYLKASALDKYWLLVQCFSANEAREALK